MRILSAFISGFVFASAVFEHPKLFARAQTYEIAEWAGIRKADPNGFRALVASFVVPDVPRIPGTGAFIGITMGDSGTDGTLDPCVAGGTVSAGIVVFTTDRGVPIYLPAYQFYPDQMRTGSGEGDYVIAPGDVIFVYIIAQPHTSPLVVLEKLPGPNSSSAWTWLQPFDWILVGFPVCSGVGEWKVATLRIKTLLGFSHLPLARIGTLTFRQAKIVTPNGAATPAGLSPLTRMSIGRYDQLLVRTKVDEHDPSVLHIYQNLPV